MTFKSDLEFGVEMERRVLGFLAKGGDHVVHYEGKNSGWDYSINNVKYEQKTDRRTCVTGNICIELMCNGKPSGILATEADYWVHYPTGMKKIAVVPVDEMRRIALEKNRRRLYCGDRNCAECLLVPWDAIPDKYKIDFPSPCFL
jgi:hypothetical protein